jgi:methylglutamate dehydrogenase subunit A
VKYSAWSLLRGALSGQRHWPVAWRDASPQPSYDVIIVGGGNTGRNATAVDL